MFLWICFNIFTYLIAYYADLSSFCLPNKLDSFPKLAKNSTTLIISNIFLFRANYAIDKNNI